MHFFSYSSCSISDFILPVVMHKVFINCYKKVFWLQWNCLKGHFQLTQLCCIHRVYQKCLIDAGLTCGTPTYLYNEGPMKVAIVYIRFFPLYSMGFPDFYGISEHSQASVPGCILNSHRSKWRNRTCVATFPLHLFVASIIWSWRSHPHGHFLYRLDCNTNPYCALYGLIMCAVYCIIWPLPANSGSQSQGS